MDEKWSLTSMLDGAYNRTVWLTQEGAISDRERILKPRRIRNVNSPTGFTTIWPIGWTAIRRVERERD